MVTKLRFQHRTPEYHPIAEVFHSSVLTGHAFTRSQLKLLQEMVREVSEDALDTLKKTATKRLNDIFSKGEAYGTWESRDPQVPSLIELTAEILQQTLMRTRLHVEANGPVLTPYVFALSRNTGTYSDLPDAAVPLMLSLTFMDRVKKQMQTNAGTTQMLKTLNADCHQAIANCLALLEMTTVNTVTGRRSKEIAKMLKS